MKYLAIYKSNLVISTRKGVENCHTMKTIIEAETIEDAEIQCRQYYGEPVSIKPCE